MKLHRFIVNFDISADQLTVTDLALVHQLHKVLRARVNYECILVRGQEEVTVRVDKILPKGLQVTVTKREQVKWEQSPTVTLYCAILKRDNFELVVQKATEIGVRRIVPLMTARTIKQNIRPERLLAIIKEATEQSGRAVVPTLGPVTSFENAIEKRDQFDRMIVCHASGEDFDWGNIQPEEKIAVVIGPEGGFDPKEIVLAKTAGVTIASLGNFTLRAETAAIVASYLVCSA